MQVVILWVKSVVKYVPYSYITMIVFIVLAVIARPDLDQETIVSVPNF